MTNEEFIKSVSLEGEEWRDVVGYEGYYIVSNLGRIATIRGSYEYTKNGKTFIKNWPRHICSTSIAPSTHYERMTFKVNYKHNTQLVHRVVAEAFLPNPNNFTCIDHIDDDPSNNRADNLQWCDYHINNSKPRHRELGSIAKRGRVDPNRKPLITFKDRQLYKIYNSMYEASLDGHLNSAILRVLRGELKTHHGLQWMYLSDYESLTNKSKNSLPAPITAD
jgi:hypothetical protein